jgi:hypothetical protein
MSHKKNKIPEVKLVITIPLERSYPYADLTIPNLYAIASMGIPAIFQPYGEVCQTINAAIEIFLMSEGTHLLILDNDHVHIPNMIEQFANHARYHKEYRVIGGVNFRRGSPYEPAIFWKNPEGGKYHTMEYAFFDWNKVYECDAIGAGCLMIAKDVFNEIERPWWEWNTAKYDRGHFQSPDIFFSEKLKAKGIKLYGDTSICSPHVTRFTVDKRVYEQSDKIMQAMNDKQQEADDEIHREGSVSGGSASA